MFFKVFIDDSGGKDYSKNYPYNYENVITPPLWNDQNTNFWRENYFVLCGIRVQDTHIARIDQEIRQLKQHCFGTDKVELKSTWLRSPVNRKVKYIDKYGISDDQVKKLGESFINLISSHSQELKIISVVFDKRYIKHREKHHPLLKSTQMILERIHYSGGKNYIVFDQMDPTLTIKKGNGKKMIQVFTGNIGVENVYVDAYSAIADMTPQNSENDNFLQIADACAYAINKQFMKYGREWLGEKQSSDGKYILTTDPVFEKLTKNFDCNRNTKEVVGYGLSLFPHDKSKRINWDFKL